ncbi:hypothetical protein SAMN05428944_0240 [Streptomyces sp. 1222.5]|uniref:hypothetical protein n=1 Tax=unclassified Streptomyces TaxID=2593676 RepID=UPI0008999CC7|nr:MULTISPECIES: hypothetical protein [unclassified Streptomyces]PKW12486.1 hypothetical protein BX260_7853 [Streptomyces sp. 5112.2]SEB55541.1 hypothetical protein SAMN05428944_0240 [Streptomyces sp. 1222.5]
MRAAYFDRPGNRWSLRLNAEQIESVAVMEANRFGRAYGVAFHADRATASLRSGKAW